MDQWWLRRPRGAAGVWRGADVAFFFGRFGVDRLRAARTCTLRVLVRVPASVRIETVTVALNRRVRPRLRKMRTVRRSSGTLTVAVLPAGIEYALARSTTLRRRAVVALAFVAPPSFSAIVTLPWQPPAVPAGQATFRGSMLDGVTVTGAPRTWATGAGAAGGSAAGGTGAISPEGVVLESGAEVVATGVAPPSTCSQSVATVSLASACT